ncbi:hypothetical protein PACID_19170 [Acidipropionibacterium acidipropionici ATCC 4875]|uniref:Uncharacterized protein n=1 Tax=Acidipropionibacterium acidipropionici (strain ATCC 4875 / DSM 20272 / JCM 6432 / NBRC 12425 / NCIMB 8070 / 4) TaxID=1171373 RepID=K7RTJ3_ACIA4|nr:hypothetical protein PACID_19170 [Acidipropionibacterium acidipropionici ATCC 4875]
MWPRADCLDRELDSSRMLGTTRSERAAGLLIRLFVVTKQGGAALRQHPPLVSGRSVLRPR